MDFKELKRLVDLIEKANISHLSIDENGTKIELKKELNNNANTVVIPQQPVVAQPVAPAAAPAETPKESKKEDPSLIDITAQMVGTYYNSPNPESPAFIKVGDTISSGQIICIIEAMKLFNEIESDQDGVVEEICVKNEEPVEFGQTLFRIRKG